MNKKIFVAALALLVFSTVNSQRVKAQSSCPISTVETYGERAPLPVDKSLQSSIEVTYFTTSDPNAFISERAGLKRSASFTHLSTNQFVAQLEKLEREGLASIRKQQAVTAYLGELAGLNLERDSSGASAWMVKTGASAQGRDGGLYNALYNLDRETSVGVYRNAQSGEYYNVSLLSSFVDVTAQGGRKVVDYDANVLLKPGETAIFKLTSDFEMKRNGGVRNYMAVTMRSVSGMGVASLAHGRSRARR